MRGRRRAAELGLRGNGALAAVVPQRTPAMSSCSSRAVPRCPLIFSPSLAASRRRRESRTPRGDRHRRCVRAADALARRVCLQHTHGRRATHLRGPARAGDAAAPAARLPPSGGEQALPACEWGVRAEGSCPGCELSALACLAGRHAAAWSADGSGLEHRLLWHQATERRQQSPEAADPEGRAAHGWADRDHGEARWRQERRSFRCRRRGEQIRRRHWRGLTCAEANALPRASIGSAHRRRARARVVGRVLRARRALCTRAPGPRPPRPS